MQINWRIIFYILAALFVCVVFLFGIHFKNFLETPLSKNQYINFMVLPGSSIKTVTRDLTKLGVLHNPRYFLFLARIKKATKYIKAGEYQIEPGTTPRQLLTKIVEGKAILRQITLVEGWHLKQILNAMVNNPYLTHTISENNIQQFATQLGAQPSLEGLLFPDTYLFTAGVNDHIILKRAFKVMQKKLNDEWVHRDPTIPYKNAYEGLIVASLIEKETARKEERSKIAGVIVRRLQKKMLLQIDASVIYGLGNNYKGKLHREDLKINTPYNTYLVKGLPPTPIAIPSRDSLNAAFHPEQGTELYYVARGDGTHEFTDSLSEHRKAIHKYRVPHLEFIELQTPSSDPYEQILKKEVAKPLTILESQQETPKSKKRILAKKKTHPKRHKHGKE
jgi:UPF0755 protein